MKAPLPKLGKEFEELYSVLPKLIASSEEEELPFTSPLAKKSKALLTQEVEDEFSAIQNRLEHGLAVILATLSSLQSKEKVIKIQQDISHCLEKISSPEQFTKTLLNAASGMTWRESLGITQANLQALYQGAKFLYAEERFEESTDAFYFLSWFECNQYDFWIALGHSENKLSHFDSAMRAYSVAHICLPDESSPYIYQALCYEAMNDFDTAERHFKEALFLETNKESPDHNVVTLLQDKLSFRRSP